MTVLFISEENSCRSQIAEAFARLLGGERWEAWSAGPAPAAALEDRAVRLMLERGIDISAQRPKGLSDIPPRRWDRVVKVGGDVPSPRFPAEASLHWRVPDPKGLPDELFRWIRDLIGVKVRDLVRPRRCHGLPGE